MSEYVVHYHAERNHQGKSKRPVVPRVTETRCEKAVDRRQRLGELLCYYHRDAA
jgi:putative transposase